LYYQQKLRKTTSRKKQKMANSFTIPSVGSQFATQKSGVVGTVQEVIANANGSYRIKLDVSGQPRWTTAK
jgi:rRNA processing protein Gar1